MTRKQFLYYLLTFILSLIVAILIVAYNTFLLKSAAMQKMPKQAVENNTEKAAAQKEAEEEKSKLRATIQSIAQYEKESIEHPTEYRYHSKLGHLYEEIRDYKEAESNFEKAILLSPFGIYSTYFDKTNFYIRTSRLVKAEKTLERIINKNNKVVVEAKGDSYIKIGDTYMDYQDYDSALREYKIALQLYKNVKKKNKQKEALIKIVEAYGAISDRFILDKNLSAAIASLQEARKYRDASYLTYKLAILYKDIDPLEAYKYMNMTFTSDPGIINYDLYEKILLDVINYQILNDNPNEVELFKNKLKIMQKFKEKYILTPFDFNIEVVSAKITKQPLTAQKVLALKFKIKNNTNYDISILFAKVNAIYNGKKRTIYNERLFSKKSKFAARTTSPVIVVKYPFDDFYDDIRTDKMKIEFFVTRKIEVRDTKIFEIEVPK